MYGLENILRIPIRDTYFTYYKNLKILVDQLQSPQVFALYITVLYISIRLNGQEHNGIPPIIDIYIHKLRRPVGYSFDIEMLWHVV